MKIINPYLTKKISKYSNLEKVNKYVLDSKDIVSLKKDVDKVDLVINIGIVNNISELFSHRFHFEF